MNLNFFALFMYVLSFVCFVHEHAKKQMNQMFLVPSKIINKLILFTIKTLTTNTPDYLTFPPKLMAFRISFLPKFTFH